MTVAAILEEVAATLSPAMGTVARDEARALIAAVVRQPKWWPSVHRDLDMAPDVEREVLRAATALAGGAPFAYAVGHADFRALTLAVDPRVLIPRPETELLVDLVLQARAGKPGGVAADVATGSGAIALALAAEGDFERVIATDLSRDALEVAGRNRDALAPALRTPVELRTGDALAPLAGERLDVLVSNPPYIAFSELGDLPALVRDWEPPHALVCADDGLAVTRSIVEGAPGVLRRGAFLAFEVDVRRARLVQEMVARNGSFTDVRVHLDLTGRERFVTARFDDSPQDR